MLPRIVFFALAVAVLISAAPSYKQLSFPLRQLSNAVDLQSLVSSGQERIAAIVGKETSELQQLHQARVSNAIVAYLAPVYIGDRLWSLIVDTGSSITWCGATTSCELTTTGKSTGNAVKVYYGSGYFNGTQYTDHVKLGGLTVTQSIGAAAFSQGTSQLADGIVGFGPVDLTNGTVANTGLVPTLLNSLKAQKVIKHQILGVHFQPEPGSSRLEANGALTLGGANASLYQGPIRYHPRLTDAADIASRYWGVQLSGFSYGKQSLGGAASAIVDTGTTLIYLPDSTYQAFANAAGASLDSGGGITRFSKKPTQNFTIGIGSTPYTLTPDQYLVPQAQYANWGLQGGAYYSWISDAGFGARFAVIGQKFLEQYYSVFDADRHRIGFAQSRPTADSATS